MRIHLEICSKNLIKCNSILSNRCSVIAITSNFHTNYHQNLSWNWNSPNNLLHSNQSIVKIDKRFIRSRYSDDKKEKEEFEKETTQQSEEKNENKEEGKKIDPALIRKLRIYILIVAGLSFVSSFFLLSQMFTGDRNIAEGLTSEDFTRPGISFDQFVQKYLNHGEVKRIVFLPANNRAVAILHQGAFVDGKPVNQQSVVIEYPQSAQSFWADIRKAEGELGIGLAQGIPIDHYQGMTTFKMIELIIGVVILAWLGTQYGRLLRQRLIENRKKMSKK